MGLTMDTERYLMAFDDDGEAVGLLKDASTGLFARSDGRWFTITASNTAFDGAEVIVVDEDFLSFFDKLDAKGVDPTYKQASAYEVEAEDELDEEDSE